MTFSPFLDDVEMEVLAQDMSSGLEPLTVKKFFFADENVYVSHASGKNVTTRGEMGVKYKKISNCSMTPSDLLAYFQESSEDHNLQHREPASFWSLGCSSFRFSGP